MKTTEDGYNYPIEAQPDTPCFPATRTNICDVTPIVQRTITHADVINADNKFNRRPFSFQIENCSIVDYSLLFNCHSISFVRKSTPVLNSNYKVLRKDIFAALKENNSLNKRYLKTAGNLRVNRPAGKRLLHFCHLTKLSQTFSGDCRGLLFIPVHIKERFIGISSNQNFGYWIKSKFNCRTSYNSLGKIGFFWHSFISPMETTAVQAVDDLQRPIGSDDIFYPTKLGGEHMQLLMRQREADGGSRSVDVFYPTKVGGEHMQLLMRQREADERSRNRFCRECRLGVSASFGRLFCTLRAHPPRHTYNAEKTPCGFCKGYHNVQA